MGITVMSEIIDMSRINHVTIISLPPHSMHKLQLIDKTFMSLLKVQYSSEIRQYLRHAGKCVTVYDVMELFGKDNLRIHFKRFQSECNLSFKQEHL